MDAKEEVTKLMAYVMLRWDDRRLKWNSSEWAGIDMIYIKVSQIWNPDIIVYNEMNVDNKEYLFSDNNLVRVYAERSPRSDFRLFNIEWTP